MKKPVRKADMLKIVEEKYKNGFLQILTRASLNMELVIGVDLKETDFTKHSYTLISKMDLPNTGRLRHGRGFPTTGLLMKLLAVIFMKGNSATEETVWEFVYRMGVYAGRSHFIFGEPQKLITQHLVQLKYLSTGRGPTMILCATISYGDPETTQKPAR